MFIDKNLDKYTILDKSSVRETLQKVTNVKSRIVMVINESGNLLGVVSNGDILRWLTEKKQPDLTSNISDVMNKSYHFITDNSSKEEIKIKLQKVNFLPLVNSQNQLNAIVSDTRLNELKLGNRIISNDNQCFIIAEIGINHNGSLKQAKELIKSAAESKADAVKIQVRDLNATYNKAILKDSLKAEHGTQYLLNELIKTELSHKDFKELKDLAENLGLIFIATPFDLPSVDFLEELDICAYKIGSPDLTNLPLLRKVSLLGKPIIISTGMSSEIEIQRVISELESINAQYALLHCNSTYPASPEDLNLKFIRKLSERSSGIVGYSGHERGYLPSIIAVAIGAKIIERHITLDNSFEGPDHSSSLEPNEFAQMIQDIRKTETCLGVENRMINQGEEVNRIALGKSLVTARKLPKGSIIHQEDIIAKTPARGVSPLEFSKFIGKKTVCNLEEDHYIQFEDIDKKTLVIDDINISKNWGIVGRLTDFEEYLDWKPKLIEIHLTWRDLIDYKRIVQKFAGKTFDQDLIVHAPEYFEDKLIDFATSDPKILEYSIEMLRLTIELTKDISSQFSGMKDSKGTKIVLHPGGHFETKKETNKTDQYKYLMQNVLMVDSTDVQILIENMPPNPWYFGGQWYNTIFLDPDEIDQFCLQTGLGMCYDTSHALLQCNYSNYDLNSFTRKIVKHVRHLHISDASGTTQEGLQLGSGNIDLNHLSEILNSIDSTFIPEIWQGHLNGGKGFRQALKIIQNILDEKLSTPGCSSVKKGINKLKDLQ
jgi:N-acetylneuraminate synthase